MMTGKEIFSTDELLSKVSYIQNSIDENFKLILNPEWNAKTQNHRVQIREFIDKNFTSRFSREQLALLYDLNWIPQAKQGFFSISHCNSLGGFSFSNFCHGFDVEEISRISVDILKRTCREAEMKECPRPEFLWVAKEAGIKALSPNKGYHRSDKALVVTDLTACDWNSHFENKVFSFRLKSSKALDFKLNKGFIFFEGDKFFCIYFS